MPRFLPYRKRSSKGKENASTPFYGLNEKLPILLALLCGLQHALAMLAGLSELT